MHRTLLPLLAIALLAGGCASTDTQVIRSTEANPASVALVDTVTGDIIWSMDVPPLHALVMDFDRTGDIAGIRLDRDLPTQMEYKLVVDDNNIAPALTTGIESGVLDLPPHQLRIDTSYGNGLMHAEAPAQTPTAMEPAAIDAQIQPDTNTDAAETMPAPAAEKAPAAVEEAPAPAEEKAEAPAAEEPAAEQPAEPPAEQPAEQMDK